MSAATNDIGGFCLPFAISTAIIAVLTRHTMTGGMCTLLLVDHDDPPEIGVGPVPLRFEVLKNGQRLIQILDEIACVLKAHRQAE